MTSHQDTKSKYLMGLSKQDLVKALISSDLELNTLIQILSECKRSQLASISYIERLKDTLRKYSSLEKIDKFTQST